MFLKYINKTKTPATKNKDKHYTVMEVLRGRIEIAIAIALLISDVKNEEQFVVCSNSFLSNTRPQN